MCNTGSQKSHLSHPKWHGIDHLFLPVLLQQAGITDTNRQRVLNFLNSIAFFVAALIDSLTVDLAGRRTLMLTATVGCVAGNAIVAALVSDVGTQTSAQGDAGVAFICEQSNAPAPADRTSPLPVLFSVGWTPLQDLYPTENLAFENRPMGLALQGWVAFTFGLINPKGGPVALACVKWKSKHSSMETSC